MLPGETIASGASDTCDCGTKMVNRVLKSNAGFYVGTACDAACGPWSRESGYYDTRELAQKALDTNTFGR